MRIHLKLEAFNKIIPFDHQPLLVGTIHKWLGRNTEHGKVALYSFSRLEGGELGQNGLYFNNESSFFISSYKIELIKQIINGIQNEPDMFHGISVKEIIIQEDPDLSTRELFFNGSPILIKRKLGSRIEHVLYNDPRAGNLLKETLQTKMNMVGMVDETFEIQFNSTYSKAKTMKVSYNGIGNKLSWCPVIIKGNAETKIFAWNVGLGNSTGIGFGAIK